MKLENDTLKSDVEDLKKSKMKQLEMKNVITVFFKIIKSKLDNTKGRLNS